MASSKDCPPCVFYGYIAELQDDCTELAKKGATTLKCDILGERAAHERIPVKDFAKQVRADAKRAGDRRMVKRIDSGLHIIAPHIRRQARGERLPKE